MFPIILGYSAFGFLIGFISGLCEGEVAQFLLGLLIAFMGGSLGYYILKDEKKLTVLGYLLFMFSLFCCIGLTTGIFLKINRVFIVKNVEGVTGESPKILKSTYTTDMTIIRKNLRDIESKGTVNIKEEVTNINNIVNKYD